MHFDPNNYGPAFAELLATDRNRPLDRGTPHASSAAILDGLAHSAAFGPTQAVNRQMADACFAGVWLLYDHLDESHRISQHIDNASGSFWHGIMHRREGDFANAKYWFRSVGHHAIYDALAAEAEQLATEHEVAGLLPTADWDAAAFVDACQQAVQRGNAAAFCRAVQQREWELLFDHCYRMSTQ